MGRHCLPSSPVAEERNIALVGLPGGGKSTVGRHLGKRLLRPFVDADTVIEQRIARSIRSFFEQEGEAAFRDIESEVIAQLCVPQGIVLATGGGATLREANRHELRAHCNVIYLRSTPEELYRRLRHDTQRPLLQVRDPLSRLREMYEERDPLYKSVAHFVIETGRPSVPVLVNTLVMQLELMGILSPEPEPQPLDRQNWAE